MRRVRLLALLVAAIAAIAWWWTRETAPIDSRSGGSSEDGAIPGAGATPRVGEVSAPPANGTGSGADSTAGISEPSREMERGSVDSTTTATIEKVRLKLRVVRRDDGAPVEGATVWSRYGNPRLHALDFFDFGVTDRDGGAELMAPRDGAIMLAAKPVTVALEPGERTVDTRALADGEEFRIEVGSRAVESHWLRVLSREDGKPIRGARVTPLPISRVLVLIDSADVAVTDGDGIAEFVIAKGRSWPVDITAAGRSATSVVVVSERNVRRDRPLTVTLARGCAITGSVRSSSGEPLAEARVTVHAPVVAVRQGRWSGSSAESVDECEVATIESGDDGRFELVDLPADTKLRIEALGDGWRAPRVVELKVPAGDRAEIELIEPAEAVVRGRVVRPDGTPSSHAMVRLKHPATRGIDLAAPHAVMVDDDGTFEMPPIAAGPWIVTATEAIDGAATSSSRAFEFDDAMAPPWIELRLATRVKVRGQVVKADGAPAPGRWIALLRRDAEEARRDCTDENGRFQLGDIEPEHVHLRIDPLGVGTEGSDFVFDPLPDEELLLRLPPADERGETTLSGHVLAGGRSALFRSARIAVFEHGRGFLARPTNDTWWAKFELEVGDDGAFLIVVPRGPIYDLVATCPGSESLGWRAGIETADQESIEGLDLAVTPGASVTVHLVDRATGAPLLQWHLVTARVGEVVVVEEGLAPGLFADWVVPAGRVTFEASTGSGVVASEERTIAAGESIDVELKVAPK